MTKEEINIYKNLKKSNKEIDIKNDDNFISYSEHTFQIIDQLFGIMIKLKLSNIFIYSVYSELCGEYIFDDKLFNRLIKEMINGLEYLNRHKKWKLLFFVGKINYFTLNLIVLSKIVKEMIYQLIIILYF